MDKLKPILDEIKKLNYKRYEGRVTQEDLSKHKELIFNLELQLFENKLIKKSLKGLGGPGVSRQKFDSITRICQRIFDDIFEVNENNITVCSVKKRPFELLKRILS